MLDKEVGSIGFTSLCWSIFSRTFYWKSRSWLDKLLTSCKAQPLDTIEIDQISPLVVKMVLHFGVFVDPLDKDLEPHFLLKLALAFTTT